MFQVLRLVCAPLDSPQWYHRRSCSLLRRSRSPFAYADVEVFCLLCFKWVLFLYSDKGDVLLPFLCYFRGHEGLLLISWHVAIYNANGAVLVVLYCPFTMYCFHSNLHRVLIYK